MRHRTGKISHNIGRASSRPYLSFLLLGLAILLSGIASAKTPAKPRAKKPAPRKVSVRKAPAKRTVRTATRKTTPAPSARRTVVAQPAPAEIPVVTQPAALWQDCLQADGVPQLATRLQLDESKLRSVLSEREMLPAPDSPSCLPYVGATGGEGGAATALFRPATNNSSNALLVSRTADSLAVIGREFHRAEAAPRILTFPAHEYAVRHSELLSALPEPIQWQLAVLIPKMIPAGENHTVRISLGQDAESGREHIHSLEILETISGKLVDGAWWMERKDGPSTIVGLNGTAYERSLWLAPIEYVRKSRGAGPTSAVVRRNFAAPKGSSRTRYITVRGFHLGADLTAPTGTPIHTVADGVVSFAGRQGGYGNLVIVDHGRGYQTYYAHLSAFQPGVRVGTAVTRGEIIGKVGSTGRSTAPHLHFETRKDKHYLDPYDESRQLDFWLLTPEEHERLVFRVLSSAPHMQPAPTVASGGSVD